MNRGPLGTPFIYLPPWHGDVHAPAIPDAEGHFDHYTPGMPGFAAAHIFGCVRFTLDVWEGYIGQPLVWHFRDHADRLEISLLPEWDNAQYGYGFLEAGSQRDELGRPSLSVSISMSSPMRSGTRSFTPSSACRASAPNIQNMSASRKSFSDCVSLIAAMHFPSVIAQVLDQTHGNLYRTNRLARFSESSTQSQIRSANNTSTMAEFVNGWTNEHALSQPLTGAIFDILVDIFHESLVERGLITPDVENLADLAEIDPRFAPALQSEFDHAFGGDPDAILPKRSSMRATLWDTISRRPCGNLAPTSSTMAMSRAPCLRSIGSKQTADIRGFSFQTSSGAALAGSMQGGRSIPDIAAIFIPIAPCCQSTGLNFRE